MRALENGWLRGAALDVFPEEPLQAQSALWNHPKVVGKLFHFLEESKWKWYRVASILQNYFSESIWPAIKTLAFSVSFLLSPFPFPFSRIRLQWTPIPSDSSCGSHVQTKRHCRVLPAKPGQVKPNKYNSFGEDDYPPIHQIWCWRRSELPCWLEKTLLILRLSHI